MVTPTLINPAGIWMLSSVRQIIQMAGRKEKLRDGRISANLIQFIPHIFCYRPWDSPEPKNSKMTLENAIKKQMAPLVGANLNGDCHAMVAVDITQWYGKP